VTGRAQSRSGSLTIDLASQLKNKRFRDSYLAQHLKVFLAAQIRALRGDMSQAEFGKLIDMPQSVVSRLENQSYGKVNVQTLLKIAIKLDVALIIRFVGFKTFLDWTKDHSLKALAPDSYEKENEKSAAPAESETAQPALSVGQAAFDLATVYGNQSYGAQLGVLEPWQGIGQRMILPQGVDFIAINGTLAAPLPSGPLNWATKKAKMKEIRVAQQMNAVAQTINQVAN
jgi:transcriptional regulator with XRE-family HTH domain